MVLINLFQTMATTFRTFFDALTMPIVDFIEQYGIGGEWLADLLNNLNITAIIGENATLGGLLLGSLLLGVFVIQIVYFFIP